jgi:hypothetical protein
VTSFHEAKRGAGDCRTRQRIEEALKQTEIALHAVSKIEAMAEESTDAGLRAVRSQMDARERVSELEEQVRSAKQEVSRLEEKLRTCQASEASLKRVLDSRGHNDDVQRQSLQLRVISQAREGQEEAKRAAAMESQLANEFRLHREVEEENRSVHAREMGILQKMVTQLTWQTESARVKMVSEIKRAEEEAARAEVASEKYTSLAAKYSELCAEIREFSKGGGGGSRTTIQESLKCVRLMVESWKERMGEERYQVQRSIMLRQRFDVWRESARARSRLIAIAGHERAHQALHPAPHTLNSAPGTTHKQHTIRPTPHATHRAPSSAPHPLQCAARGHAMLMVKEDGIDSGRKAPLMWPCPDDMMC